VHRMMVTGEARARRRWRRSTPQLGHAVTVWPVAAMTAHGAVFVAGPVPTRCRSPVYRIRTGDWRVRYRCLDGVAGPHPVGGGPLSAVRNRRGPQGLSSVATRSAPSSSSRALSRTLIMEAGYLGVGAMGQPMAHKLLDAGHGLTVSNINEAAMRLLLDRQAAASCGAAGPRRPL
jgi:hypothetical protein